MLNGAHGVSRQTADQLPSLADRFTPNPHVSANDGGHVLNMGLHCLRTIESALLAGVGDAAAHVMEHIRSRD